MIKEKKWTIVIVLSLAIILLGAYFVAVHFGWLPKSGLRYERENSIQSLDQQVVEEKKENPPIADVQPPTETEEKKELEEKKADDTAPLPEKAAPKQEKNTEDKTDNEEPAKDANAGKIVDRLMTSGFKQSSGRKIDTIIIHTSYNAIGSDPYDIGDIIKQYQQYEVSAHYLIGRDGTIYRLVEDKNIAWHAGVSKMPDGRTNVNDFSLGIEVVNTKEGKFSDAQYDSLNKLIKSLKDKYPIENILGHKDIAPGRKTDPWGIEWGKVKK